MAGTLYKYSYKSAKRNIASLAVYNVGFALCNGGCRWGPGVRDHYLMHHVVSGEGYYTTGDKTYSVKAGETFFSLPDTLITYISDEKNPWQYYWVGFNGSEAPLLLSKTDLSGSNPIFKNPCGGEIKQLLLEIYKCRGDTPMASARMIGKLYELFAVIMENSKVFCDSEMGEYVQSAMLYIACNYSFPITVEEIAAHVEISRSQLCRLFKSALNCSPIQYLTKYRIDRSCDLISNTKFTMEEVAHSVGYYDALYFSKVFSRINGSSPSEFRRRSRGGLGADKR